MGRPASMGDLATVHQLHPNSPGHDVLVFGPEPASDLASGRHRRAGWVWSCSCGAGSDGWPSEDAADDDADAHLDAQLGRGLPDPYPRS